MKLKKLIVGLVFLTVFTCGYTPPGYSFHYEPPQRAELVVKRSCEKSLSQLEIGRRGERKPIPVTHSFKVKVNCQFFSSPPRASP